MTDGFLRFVCSLAAALVLVGCGGGSTNDQSDATSDTRGLLNQVTFATIDRAISRLYSRPVSLPFEIGGQISGTVITGNGKLISLEPVSSIFEGFSSRTQNLTASGTYFAGTKGYPFTSVSNEITDTGFNPVGSISDGKYTVLKRIVPKIDAPDFLAPDVLDRRTVVWWTGEIYSNSTKAVKTGSKTISVKFVSGQPSVMTIFTDSFDMQSKKTEGSVLEVELGSQGEIVYKTLGNVAPNGDISGFKFGVQK